MRVPACSSNLPGYHRGRRPAQPDYTLYICSKHAFKYLKKVNGAGWKTKVKHKFTLNVFPDHKEISFSNISNLFNTFLYFKIIFEQFLLKKICDFTLTAIFKDFRSQSWIYLFKNCKLMDFIFKQVCLSVNWTKQLSPLCCSFYHDGLTKELGQLINIQTIN